MKKSAALSSLHSEVWSMKSTSTRHLLRVSETVMFRSDTAVHSFQMWYIFCNNSSFYFAEVLSSQENFTLFWVSDNLHFCIYPLSQTLRYKSNYLISITDSCDAEDKFKHFSYAVSIYISVHLFCFRFQCVSIAVEIAVTVAVSVLEAADFEALSSVTDSSAAVWQTLIETVKTESLFAWCQSAAMSSAAVNEIIAVTVLACEYWKCYWS